MDFKKIKNIWKSSFNENKQLNKAQIEAMLKIKSKSNTALNKLEKSFKFELIASSIIYLVIIAGLIFLVKTLIVFAFILGVTIIMGWSYYLHLNTYKKIKKTNISDSSLKQELTKLVTDIESFITIGQRNILKFIIIPLSTFFGMLIGLYIANDGKSIVDTVSSFNTKTIIILIILLLVFNGVVIFLSIIKFKNTFKRHFKELDDCLKELNEFDNI